MTVRARQVALFAAVAVAAVAAGIATQWRWREGGSTESAVAAIRGAQLADLQGVPRSLKDWQGKVLVANYWATWCAPCREEMPIFVKLQEKYGENGLVFVGIAIDQKARVEAFAHELGVNYPILLGSLRDMELTKAVGNRLVALPFTLVFDREGRLLVHHLGAITQPELERIIAQKL